MTNSKFEQEFQQWEDADYSKGISEFAKQDLLYKRNRKQKVGNVIKNSFIKDQYLNEEPLIQKSVQTEQFTDVMTPVQRTPFQEQLWKQFKSGHYGNVDYKNRDKDGSNLEVQYDLLGNRQIYEKVFSNKPVKMNTKITVDIDPYQGMLDQVKNPLKSIQINHQTENNYQMDFNKQSNYFAKPFSLENMLNEIDVELKAKSK